MSRIYRSEEARTTYQGSAPSVGFNPLQTVNSERQLRDYKEARLQDAETIGRELGRNLRLEEIQLSAQQLNTRGQQDLAFRQEGIQLNQRQAYDKGVLAQQQLAESNQLKMSQASQEAMSKLGLGQLSLSSSVTQSNTQAAGAAILGLMGLSRTLMDYQVKMADIKKTEQQQAELANALFGDLSVVTDPKSGQLQASPTPAQQQISQNNQAILQADTQGTANVAEPMMKSNNPVDQEIGLRMRQSTLWNQLGEVRGNVYAARLMFGPALDQAAAEGLISPGAQGLQDAQRFAVEFAKATGITGNKQLMHEHFVPTAFQQMQNKVAQVTAEHNKAVITANQVQNRSRVSDLADGSTVADVGKNFELANLETINSNLGFANGGKATAETNAYVVGLFATNLADEGKVRELQALRSHVYNKSTGRTLGQDFDEIFDKAEQQAINRNIDIYQTNQRLDAIKLDSIERKYLADPGNADARLEYFNYLTRPGASPEEYKKAQELASSGLRYNPNVSLNWARSEVNGKLPTTDEVNFALRQGLISSKEHKDWIARTSDGPIQTNLKPIFDTLKSDLRKALTAGVEAKGLDPISLAKIGQRVDAAYDLIKERVTLQAVNDPSIAKDPNRLRVLTEQQIQKVVSQPEFTATYNSNSKSITFGRELINPKVRTIKPGVDDFTSYSPERLFSPSSGIPRNQMQPTRDVFLNPNQLLSDVAALQNNEPLSNRTRLIAKNLGISPRALIDGQLKAQGKGGLTPYLRSIQQPGQTSIQLQSASPYAPPSVRDPGQLRTIQMGRQLFKAGYRMWQHPNFDLERGYVPSGGQRVAPAGVSGRGGGSAHHTNQALDFPLSHNSEAQLDRLYKYLNANKDKFGIAELLWRSAGHYDHLHVAFR